MPEFYKPPHANISSISVDGVEHKVNDDGLLEVEVVTQNLRATLATKKYVLTQPLQLSDDEVVERTTLLTWLDDALGRKFDRRKSLPQLRAEKARLEAVQAKTAAAGTRGS